MLVFNVQSVLGAPACLYVLIHPAHHNLKLRDVYHPQPIGSSLFQPSLLDVVSNVDSYVAFIYELSF